MASLEGLHDRHDRRGLSFVALVAADLKREPIAIHEQTDDDLRVHPALFRVPDPRNSSSFSASKYNVVVS